MNFLQTSLVDIFFSFDTWFCLKSCNFPIFEEIIYLDSFLVTLILVLQGLATDTKICVLSSAITLSQCIFALFLTACLLQPQNCLSHWVGRMADGSLPSSLTIVFHVIFGQKLKFNIPFERKFHQKHAEIWNIMISLIIIILWKNL